MIDQITRWMAAQGVGDPLAEYLGWISAALAVIILAWVCNLIAKRVLLTGLSFVVRRSRTDWDDALMRQKVFVRLSHFAPALVIYVAAPVFPTADQYLVRLAEIYMMAAGLMVVSAFLNAVVDIYRSFDISRQRPIKGYIQVAKIIITIFVIIVALSTLLGKSPWLLLSGFGALTAVLLLVFKDSILGLVASLQLSMNDMVRIGDWIEMPKYGADGDVVDVTLHTVKVQNWDKTITTIPAYSLISDSFRNWRGMSESGGRRIKRSVFIDMTSIRFCTSEMLDRYESYQLITEYIKTRRSEIAAYNKEHEIDTRSLVNGRNLTNVGTFRAYLVAYLRQHPKIHQDMTFLIRQLAPSEHGLPIEIYVFSNDQVWANYEAIQADIFDHILAVMPMFDLRVYQFYTGVDSRAQAVRQPSQS